MFDGILKAIGYALAFLAATVTSVFIRDSHRNVPKTEHRVEIKTTVFDNHIQEIDRIETDTEFVDVPLDDPKDETSVKIEEVKKNSSDDVDDDIDSSDEGDDDPKYTDAELKIMKQVEEAFTKKCERELELAWMRIKSQEFNMKKLPVADNVKCYREEDLELLHIDHEDCTLVDWNSPNEILIEIVEPWQDQ